jgi:hypothetical protein
VSDVFRNYAIPTVGIGRRRRKKGIKCNIGLQSNLQGPRLPASQSLAEGRGRLHKPSSAGACAAEPTRAPRRTEPHTYPSSKQDHSCSTLRSASHRTKHPTIGSTLASDSGQRYTKLKPSSNLIHPTHCAPLLQRHAQQSQPPQAKLLTEQSS